MEYFWLTIIIIAAIFLVGREMRRSMKGGACGSCPSGDSCCQSDREECEKKHEEVNAEKKDS